MEKHNLEKIKVTKSLELNRASYSMTLDERRLILSAIAKIDPRKKMPEYIDISAQEYADIWHMDTANAYVQLRKAQENLYNRSIVFRKKDSSNEPGGVIKMRWIDAVTYYRNEGYIQISFSKKIEPYLSELKNKYTEYRLTEVSYIKSGHAIRLYELLMQWQSSGEYYDSLNALKNSFGVQNNYPRWADFKRKVIDPSVREINECTPFSVKYTLTKKGRSVAGVNFKFKVKTQLDLFNQIKRTVVPG